MPRPTNRFAAVAGLFAFAAVVALSGCGDDTPTATERPLTFDEASMMAEVLYRNYEDGGASYVVNTITATGGPQLTLSGQVDWTTHTGWADVTTGMAGATLTGVMWTHDTVLERRPSLDTILIGLGTNDPPLIGRSPDPERRLDQVIAVVTALAATQRENAQLSMQTEGSAFVRDDTLRGREVHVVRYGTRNLYWIDAETGDLLRLEATSKSGGIPTVVDLLERGPVTIDMPDPSHIVAVDSIADIYNTMGPL